MDSLKFINEMRAEGMSKTQIERELGLPKNSLSNVCAGRRGVPSGWVAKILNHSRYKQIEKMAALGIERKGFDEMVDDLIEMRNQENGGQVPSQVSSDNQYLGTEALRSRLDELEKELANPPKKTLIDINLWKQVRKIEVNQIKEQLGVL